MKDEVFTSIGARITRIRKINNITQEKLAILSGLDRSHIGFIEQGRRKPTISTLQKISRALDVPLDELIKGL